MSHMVQRKASRKFLVRDGRAGPSAGTGSCWEPDTVMGAGGEPSLFVRPVF